MSEIHKSPSKNIIEELEFLSKKENLIESWFNLGTSTPAEDFVYLFESPHIEWEKLFPNITRSEEYNDLYFLMDYLSGDKFNINNHIDVKKVQNSILWEQVPCCASRLLMRIL